jgi:hypothetical protein
VITFFRAPLLRKIQLTATSTAVLMSAVALFDVVMQVAGKQSSNAGTFPLGVGAMLAPIAGAFKIIVGTVLTLVALLAVFSVMKSCRLVHDGLRLESWRRLTWAASIVETSGALLFVFSGSVLFLPAAVALLLVGVAELASILREMEQRADLADHALARRDTQL